MKTALIGLLLLPLAACVSSGPKSQIGTQEKADKARRIQMKRTSDCVFQSTISGFHMLDDTHVVFYGMGRRKAYLAEIAGACFDAKYETELVSVDGDRNGQICGFGRDSVAFRRLGRVENCRILALEDLSEERRLELGLAAP
jgi:hypothetical protein